MIASAFYCILSFNYLITDKLSCPSRSAYEDSFEWLSSLDSREDAKQIAMDVQAHRNLVQG